MTDLNHATYSITASPDHAMAQAVKVFADARAIVTKPALATVYAEKAADKISGMNTLPPAERQRLITMLAANARACASKIVADGRAHYRLPQNRGKSILVVATLAADASAGPVGYMPLLSVPVA